MSSKIPEEEFEGEITSDEEDGERGAHVSTSQRLQLAPSQRDAGRSAGASESPEGLAQKAKKKPAKKRKPFVVSVNLGSCKYEVLRLVLDKLGWKEVGEEDEWDLYWTDTSIGLDRVLKLARYQKINHFNGMLEICRKNRMGRNLGKMEKAFPKDYDFIPITFDLPAEMSDFLAQFSKKKRHTFILKPDAGCQGKGIRLVQTLEQANKAFKEYTEVGISSVVAQRYVMKPLLVNGYKFDLRVYVVVISVDPLRMFAFHEGLARFCTERYQAPTSDNLEVGFMHLTNYAVNKKNTNFVFNSDAARDDDGSKWSMTALGHHLDSQGLPWAPIWAGICDIAVKTVISIQPLLRSLYRSATPPDNDGFSCFEILGMDVLLDSKGKPMLLEVNHSPSFTTDTPLDLSIKEELIRETIQLARVDPEVIRKRKASEKKASERRLLNLGAAKKKASEMTPDELRELRERGLARREDYESESVDGRLHFERIYPSRDPERQKTYDKLLEGSLKIYQDGNALHRAQAALNKLSSSKRGAGKSDTGTPPKESGQSTPQPAPQGPKKVEGSAGNSREASVSLAAGTGREAEGSAGASRSSTGGPDRLGSGRGSEGRQGSARPTQPSGAATSSPRQLPADRDRPGPSGRVAAGGAGSSASSPMQPPRERGLPPSPQRAASMGAAGALGTLLQAANRSGTSSGGAGPSGSGGGGTGLWSQQLPPRQPRARRGSSSRPQDSDDGFQSDDLPVHRLHPLASSGLDISEAGESDWDDGPGPGPIAPPQAPRPLEPVSPQEARLISAIAKTLGIKGTAARASSQSPLRGSLEPYTGSVPPPRMVSSSTLQPISGGPAPSSSFPLRPTNLLGSVEGGSRPGSGRTPQGSPPRLAPSHLAAGPSGRGGSGPFGVPIVSLGTLPPSVLHPPTGLPVWQDISQRRTSQALQPPLGPISTAARLASNSRRGLAMEASGGAGLTTVGIGTGAQSSVAAAPGPGPIPHGPRGSYNGVGGGGAGSGASGRYPGPAPVGRSSSLVALRPRNASELVQLPEIGLGTRQPPLGNNRY